MVLGNFRMTMLLLQVFCLSREQILKRKYIASNSWLRIKNGSSVLVPGILMTKKRFCKARYLQSVPCIKQARFLKIWALGLRKDIRLRLKWKHQARKFNSKMTSNRYQWKPQPQVIPDFKIFKEILALLMKGRKTIWSQYWSKTRRILLRKLLWKGRNIQ
jgi:hypothetical protein